MERQKESDGLRVTHTNRETDTHSSRQTQTATAALKYDKLPGDSPRDRQTERHRHLLTDRQIDTHKQTAS